MIWLTIILIPIAVAAAVIGVSVLIVFWMEKDR